MHFSLNQYTVYIAGDASNLYTYKDGITEVGTFMLT